jgi:hypothetical protein
MFYLQIAEAFIGSGQNHVHRETDSSKVSPAPELTSDGVHDYSNRCACPFETTVEG